MAKRSATVSTLGTVRGAIGWRAGQQAGVQAIYFLRLLILARLLTPEAFGQLAIAMLIVTILLSLSDLGVVPALVQRERSNRDEQDAGWTLGVLRAVLIAATIIATAPLLAALFGDPRTTPIIRALALRPVLAALASIGVVQLTRELRFRQLAMLYVPAALIDLCAAIVLAPRLGVWALVAGSLIGTASGTILSYVLAPHRPRPLFDRATMRPLIHFGRWVLGTSIVGLAASSAVQLVVSRRLGVTDLGLYFLATKVAFLPAEAATAVIGSVAFPMYASMQNDDPRTRATLQALLSMLALVLFPTYVLMIVLAPSLAEALGPQWAGTAPLIQIVGLAAAIGIYVDATLPLLMGRGRPDRVMIVCVTQTGVLLALLLPLVSTLGALGAAAAWLPAYAAAQVVSALLVRSTIGPKPSGAAPQLLAILAVSIAAGTAAALVPIWFSGFAAVAGGGLAGAVTGGILLGGLSRRMDFGIRGLLRAPAGQLAS
jgi:O-antigen/teichoic acid export membrane protein